VKPLLLFTAPVSSRSGYGHHARDIVRALIELNKFDIHIMDLRWGGTPRNALKIDNTNDYPIIERLMKTPQLPRQPDIHIHLTVPNEFQQIGKYNIGITAGIETTLCSVDWISGMNRMNMNIVPSVFSKEVFDKSTWTEREKETNRPIRQLKNEKPIEVLFEGVDSLTYHKINKDTEEYPKLIVNEMKNVKSTFNFLFVGHWLKGDIHEDRKDVGGLIETFLNTFSGEKNQPGLILKTSGATFSVMDREEIIKKINYIKSIVNKKNLPPIYLLHGEMTDSEMNALYNHPKIKAHITFTKGEGFGRPLLEASISGKPVIATNWGGHVDYLQKDLAVLLPGQLKNVHKSASWDNVILKESQWFQVDYTYASNMLREIWRNYKKYEINSLKLSEINKQKFSFEKMKLELNKILTKYLPEFSQPKEVNLPNLPTLKHKEEENMSGIKKVILPKLKLQAHEPSAGSSVINDDKLVIPVFNEENVGEK